METIIVKNQKDFNKIKDNFEGRIEIVGNIDEVNRYFNNAYIVVYGNATIKSVYGNATIKYVSGNATIKYVYGNATIKYVYDNATIESVYGNATIKSVYGNATIKYVYDNATIESVSGNATIKYVYDNATIKYVYDNATIESVSGNATIKYVYDNATIESISDNATIESVSGNATIALMTGLSSLALLYSAKKIVAKGMNLIRQIGLKEIDIEKGEGVSFVQIKENINENPSFSLYRKFYPIEEKSKKAIMYKAVHKVDGKYISDHDGSFKYEIGLKIEHKNAPAYEGSCATGLHVSHKNWAVFFGKDWYDMALLECEVPIDKIVVCSDCDGKVRTSELKVLREVPKEEW